MESLDNKEKINLEIKLIPTYLEYLNYTPSPYSTAFELVLMYWKHLTTVM